MKKVLEHFKDVIRNMPSKDKVFTDSGRHTAEFSQKTYIRLWLCPSSPACHSGGNHSNFFISSRLKI